MPSFDAYIRVSRVGGRSGPSYISPDVQRDTIQKWADYRGIRIAAWHVDEDESGGTQNRPGIRAAISRVEAGQTDGIVSARLNRFARNVGEAVQDVKRIQAAKGQLAFVEEGIDPTGPFGQFLLTIMLAVATLERDNLAAGFHEAKIRATARGAYNARTPYGFQRLPDGTLEPSPIEAIHVQQAFKLAKLKRQDALTYLQRNASGHAWTMTTVRRLLANPIYKGEIRLGDAINLAGVPALVSPQAWLAAQSEAPAPRRAPNSFPLAGGFALCATCGSKLVGSSSGPSKAPVKVYRCSRSPGVVYRGDPCPKPASIVSKRLESHVRELITQNTSRFAIEYGDSDLIEEAELAIAETETELNAFASDLTARRLLGVSYHEHLTKRADAVSEARRRYADLARQEGAASVLASELIGSADLRELAELLSSLGIFISVAPGRRNVVGRVKLVDANSATGETPLS